MKKIFTAREPLSHIFLFCYFLLIGTSTFSQWVSRMNGLRPRSEVTSIVYNGKVYAFFGFSDSLLTVVERSVEVYDSITGSAYNRPLKVEVNGIVIASSLAFPPTGAWSTWSYVSVTANLIAGINKVRLTSIGSSGANIDHLAWANTAAASPSIASVLSQDMVATDFSAFLAPNPASGIVKLSLSGYSDERVEISIAYASGGVYKTFPARYINNGQFNFSVSDWPAGLYIVLVRQGKERASVKLIVGSLK